MLAGVARDQVTYSSAISAFCDAAELDTEAAMACLALLRDMEVPPDTYTFGSAMDACRRAGMWENALHLLQTDMKAAGVEADHVCYNIAIAACSKAGRWEKAVGLLREMERKDLAPDTRSYASAINACARGNAPTIALSLLKEMKARGVRTNQVVYKHAIFACRDGMAREALQLLEEVATQWKPEQFSVELVLLACWRAGDMERLTAAHACAVMHGTPVSASWLQKVSVSSVHVQPAEEAFAI
jgi:pentatricopeptide repeat protein